MTVTLCFYAQFTATKAGLNGLSPTWDIDRITRSDGTRSALVSGGANSITIGRRGLYGYLLSGADLALYDYIGTAVTADTTVDLKEVPAMWTIWSIDSYNELVSGTYGLAVLKAYVDELETRLTATRAGYLDNLSVAPSTLTAQQVWEYGTRTLTSLSTLVSSIAAAVWTYATRSLTQTPAASTDGTTAGAISRTRGDTWSITITADFSGSPTVWFTIKANTEQADSASLLQIKTTAGLVYLNGAAGTAGQGSITIAGDGASAVIAVDEAATVQLPPALYVYDVQKLVGGNVTTVDRGTFTVTGDVTRSVS